MNVFASLFDRIKLQILVLSFCAASCVHAQSEDRVLATVNGRVVTGEEVDSLVAAQTMPLEQSLHAIRKTALENLIISRVLEDEAKKRGISVARLRQQMSAGPIEVSETQVEEAYAENASFFASMSPDEAKERLRMDLESRQRMQNYRAALAKLKAAATVNVRLTEPRLPPLGVDSTTPSLGKEDARVTITEYSDFECPYCRSVQTTLKEVMRLYGGDVRLVFKHLPLDIHEHSFTSARAATCAAEQSKFWPYHDALFAVETLDRETLIVLAEKLGMNSAEFKNCLAADRTASLVRQNVAEAKRLGINSTPTFVINGRIARGALTLEQFKEIIEEELSSLSPQSAKKGLDR